MFSDFIYWTAIKIVEKIVRDKKGQVPLQTTSESSEEFLAMTTVSIYI